MTPANSDAWIYSLGRGEGISVYGMGEVSSGLYIFSEDVCMLFASCIRVKDQIFLIGGQHQQRGALNQTLKINLDYTNRIAIDTGAGFHGGKLSAVALQDGKVVKTFSIQ